MQFNLKLACFPGLLPVPTFFNLKSLSPSKSTFFKELERMHQIMSIDSLSKKYKDD